MNPAIGRQIRLVLPVTCYFVLVTLALVNAHALAAHNDQITACRACPRLVEWREAVARDKRRMYADWEYWGRPVPGFGDPAARLLVVGLAPAAHGGNRTGRIFTGDRSGDWLYGAMYRAGFANQPTSQHRDDGLALTDAYISAVVRCAPPANKPTPQERDTCIPYLKRDLQLLPETRVIIALGAFAAEAAGRLCGLSKRVKFGHGAESELPNGKTLLCSYHPSQQNTFTGRLTQPMFDSVFDRANELIQGR